MIEILKNFIVELVALSVVLFHIFIAALPVIILLITFSSVVFRLITDYRDWKSGNKNKSKF